MGQPTQRATNYTARSNIEPAQFFLHANGQSAPRSGGARDVGGGAGSHTPSTASESFSHEDEDVRSTHARSCLAAATLAWPLCQRGVVTIGLDKILCYFEAYVHE